MDLKQVIIRIVVVSIVSTVFGFGLNTTAGDLLYLVRRPGLLARSLLAVFVIMPVFAAVLVRVFDFQRTVEIALVALAISPLPPMLPRRVAGTGGQASYVMGLMAILALLSIAIVPAALELLALFSGRPLSMAPGAVASVALKSALAPLAAGMVVRAALPALAARVGQPVALLGKVLLPLGVLGLLYGAFPAMWGLVGDGTVLAMVIFVVAGLGIGHVLGGPDPDHSTVLALSTACRHPAIALSIAAANFPEQRFPATILLYMLVNIIVGVPYVKWMGKQSIVVS
jgi:bile acid:Na+ symporter, BASS family